MFSPQFRKLAEISFDYEKILSYIPAQQCNYLPDPALPPVLRHAEAFCAVMEEMPLAHIPGARLGGFGGDKFISRPNHLTEEEFEQIRNYPKDTVPEVLETLREEIFFLWPFADGHIIPGYTQVLEQGLEQILKKVRGRKSDPTLSKKQQDLLDAMSMELEGVLHAAERYSAFYAELAAHADSENAAVFLEISEMLQKVPRFPASTFREALQSVWFFHMCVQFDDVSNHSLGRLDQYLYPYYKKDLAAQILTEQEAKELFFEFWLRFTPGYLKSREEGERSEGQGFIKDNIPENGLTWMTLKAISHVKHVDDGQTITLCGYTPDGKDGTNVISHLCIEALANFKTFEPKPNIMLTEITDPEILKKSYEILSTGHALPGIAFYERIAKGFDHYQPYFDKSDYWKICQIGCVENGIAEKSYVDPMNCFLNLPKVLLSALYNGNVNGKQLGLRRNIPQNYAEFEQRFYLELEHYIDMYVAETNKANPFYSGFFYRPLISAVIEGCIDSATAVDEGGSVYWNKCVNCTGFATTVNSLAAIRRIVYEEKLLSLAELRHLLSTDFSENETMRSYMQNRIPKYGNGESETDEVACRLAEKFSEIVRRKKTYRGTSYRPGIYSFYEAIRRMGKLTGATPDGRRSGEKLSINTSPAHGTIQNGLTSALRSLTSFDHALMDNACTADVALDFSATPDMIGYIVEYLRRHGALFLQLSVINKERLLEAEKHPEDHKDLVVRVSGFSAQYVFLDAATRREILERSLWN